MSSRNYDPDCWSEFETEVTMQKDTENLLLE